MRRVLWWLLTLGIASQAITGLWPAARAWASRMEIGYGQRLCETTEIKLAREFGADFELVQALASEANDGEQVLIRIDVANPALVTTRVELFGRIRHAVYPKPTIFMQSALSDPIAFAEQNLPPGQSALLVVFPGETSPEGRPGWLRCRATQRFQLWRIQKP